MGISYRVVVTASAYILAASVCLGAAPATYRVTPIPNGVGCAYGINNREQVVGEMPGVNGRSAFLWSAAMGIIDIGFPIVSA